MKHPDIKPATAMTREEREIARFREAERKRQAELAQAAHEARRRERARRLAAVEAEVGGVLAAAMVRTATEGLVGRDRESIADLMVTAAADLTRDDGARSLRAVVMRLREPLARYVVLWSFQVVRERFTAGIGYEDGFVDRVDALICGAAPGALKAAAERLSAAAGVSAAA